MLSFIATALTFVKDLFVEFIRTLVIDTVLTAVFNPEEMDRVNVANAIKLGF